MLKLFSLAAGLLACSLVFAQSDQSTSKGGWGMEPDSFNGIILGKTLEDNGIPPCPAGVGVVNHRDYAERCYLKGRRFIHVNGFPFDFAKEGMIDTDENGQITKIFLSFSQSKFKDMADVLIERYGRPTSISSRQVGNKIGALFESSDLVWSGAVVEISATERVHKIDTSSLLVALKKDLRKSLEKRINESRETASKL